MWKARTYYTTHDKQHLYDTELFATNEELGNVKWK